MLRFGFDEVNQSSSAVPNPLFSDPLHFRVESKRHIENEKITNQHNDVNSHKNESEKVKTEKLVIGESYKDEAVKDPRLHDTLDASSGNSELDYKSFIWIIILCGTLAIGWKYTLRK